MYSDLEMSDLSSRQLVAGENSGCESDSDFIAQQHSEGKRNRRKRRNQQRDPVAMTSNHTDDDTESQLNFEESPVNSTAYSTTSPVSMHYQDKMRRRLQFFFMNPVEKWQAKRR